MPDRPHPYKIVGEFLNGFLRVEALAAAFELGVIAALEQRAPASTETLAQSLSVDRTHLQILLDMLTHDGVLEKSAAGVALTDKFRTALTYRDLLDVRMEFARLARRALFDNYALSIRDPFRFQGRLHDFKFYPMPDYTPAIRKATEIWVRFISTFTRYAAPVCLAHHDFGRYARVLDVGGNNGELALQMCRKHPNVHVTIFDIPVVADIGSERVAAEGLSDRISFVKGDAKLEPLPGGFDAVVFSTVLTDHTAENVDLFLGKVPAPNPAPTGDLGARSATCARQLPRVGHDLSVHLDGEAPDRPVDAVRRGRGCDIASGTPDDIHFSHHGQR
jgi:hypothetical protein